MGFEGVVLGNQVILCNLEFIIYTRERDLERTTYIDTLDIEIVRVAMFASPHTAIADLLHF